MHLTAIVAMDRKGLIGANGKIPWHLPSDLQRFRRLTMGRPVIMGRKTWESLPSRPLEGRTNIVLSENLDYKSEGAIVAPGQFPARWEAFVEGYEAFIIGGAKVFEQAIGDCYRICMTVVDGDFEGDTYFPLHLLDGRLWCQVQTDGFMMPCGDIPSWSFYELAEKKQPGKHHHEIGHWVDREAYREATGL